MYAVLQLEGKLFPCIAGYKGVPLLTTPPPAVLQAFALHVHLLGDSEALAISILCMSLEVV